ncbi:MAG: DinB family protein [bacterium]|nr:DinB family protein [bacterium]
MELPKTDLTGISYPLKTLLLGNKDTWDSMLAVITDLTSEQLTHKQPNYTQRSITEMINHALDTQYGFYTKQLVLGEKSPKPLYENLAKTVAETQQRIVDTYQKVVNLWGKLTAQDFTKEIKTEWGQTLTGELALFQSITHTHYHVSEICFLRGLGGFPTKVMG